MEIILRDIDGTGEVKFNSIKEALNANVSTYKKAILSWENKQELCCLDLDDVNLTTEQILIQLQLLKPKPLASWISHSGKGIHCLYGPQEPLYSDEIAALSCLNLKQKRNELSQFELLKHSFFPPGEIHWNDEKLNDLNFLNGLLGTNSNESTISIHRDNWLAEKGYTLGNRYSHDHCIIDSKQSGSREPVIITDKGIYCFACQARTGQGFRSWFSLFGDTQDSDLIRLVKNKVHWDHAKYILRDIIQLNDNLNELIYRALLVHKHGERIRQTSVFYPYRNVIRLNKWWSTEAGEYYNKNVTGLLAVLPISHYYTDTGKTKIDNAKLTQLNQTIDLKELGYISLTPIRGCKIYGYYLEYQHKEYRIVLQNGILARDEYSKYRPKYIPKEERNLEEAWHTLSIPFPGLHQNLVLLLLAARGIAEGQIGLPAFIYLSGPTSSAKSTTIAIAAAILGDTASTIVWTNDIERVRQGILESKEKGSFVIFDEICKQAKKNGASFRQALDDCLNLTPYSLSHKLWLGPVPLGEVPVVIWTDTEVPYEIRDSTQLARRIIHCHLPGKVDWKSSITNCGLYAIERLRTMGDDYARACNAILSDVIDRFFTYQRDLESIANELGFYTLEDERDEAYESTLIDFFNSIKEANSRPEGNDSKRWSGRGWVLFQLGEDTQIGNLWGALCDSDNQRNSRRCSEANWAKIIGKEGPIEFEVQSHGNKIVVRFIKRISRKEYKVNEEI